MKDNNKNKEDNKDNKLVKKGMLKQRIKQKIPISYKNISKQQKISCQKKTQKQDKLRQKQQFIKQKSIVMKQKQINPNKISKFKTSFSNKKPQTINNKETLFIQQSKSVNNKITNYQTLNNQKLGFSNKQQDIEPLIKRCKSNQNTLSFPIKQTNIKNHSKELKQENHTQKYSKLESKNDNYKQQNLLNKYQNIKHSQQAIKQSKSKQDYQSSLIQRNSSIKKSRINSNNKFTNYKDLIQLYRQNKKNYNHLDQQNQSQLKKQQNLHKNLQNKIIGFNQREFQINTAKTKDIKDFILKKYQSQPNFLCQFQSQQFKGFKWENKRRKEEQKHKSEKKEDKNIKSNDKYKVDDKLKNSINQQQFYYNKLNSDKNLQRDDIQSKYLELQQKYKQLLLYTKNQLQQYQKNKNKLLQLKGQHFNHQKNLQQLTNVYLNANKTIIKQQEDYFFLNKHQTQNYHYFILKNQTKSKGVTTIDIGIQTKQKSMQFDLSQSNLKVYSCQIKNVEKNCKRKSSQLLSNQRNLSLENKNKKYKTQTNWFNVQKKQLISQNKISKPKFKSIHHQILQISKSNRKEPKLQKPIKQNQQIDQINTKKQKQNQQIFFYKRQIKRKQQQRRIKENQYNGVQDQNEIKIQKRQSKILQNKKSNKINQHINFKKHAEFQTSLQMKQFKTIQSRKNNDNLKQCNLAKKYQRINKDSKEALNNEQRGLKIKQRIDTINKNINDQTKGTSEKIYENIKYLKKDLFNVKSVQNSENQINKGNDKQQEKRIKPIQDQIEPTLQNIIKQSHYAQNTITQSYYSQKDLKGFPNNQGGHFSSVDGNSLKRIKEKISIQQNKEQIKRNLLNQVKNRLKGPNNQKSEQELQIQTPIYKFYKEQKKKEQNQTFKRYKFQPSFQIL